MATLATQATLATLATLATQATLATNPTPDSLDSLADHFASQRFLSFQYEAAIPLLWILGFWACAAWEDGSMAVSGFLLLLGVSSLYDLSWPRGSDPHLPTLLLRLLFGVMSALICYVKISENEKFSADHIALAWFLPDPLGWVLEVALYWGFNHPVFLWLWSLRRATLTGALWSGFFDPTSPGKPWTILMALLQTIQMAINLDEKNLFLTPGTIVATAIVVWSCMPEANYNFEKTYGLEFLLPLGLTGLFLWKLANPIQAKKKSSEQERKPKDGSFIHKSESECAFQTEEEDSGTNKGTNKDSVTVAKEEEANQKKKSSEQERKPEDGSFIHKPESECASQTEEEDSGTNKGTNKVLKGDVHGGAEGRRSRGSLPRNGGSSTGSWQPDGGTQAGEWAADEGQTRGFDFGLVICNEEYKPRMKEVMPGATLDNLPTVKPDRRGSIGRKAFPSQCVAKSLAH